MCLRTAVENGEGKLAEAEAAAEEKCMLPKIQMHSEADDIGLYVVKKLEMLLSQHINLFLLISQTIYSNTFARSFCPISPQLRTVDGGWAIQKSGVGFVQREVKDALGYW